MLHCTHVAYWGWGAQGDFQGFAEVAELCEHPAEVDANIEVIWLKVNCLLIRLQSLRMLTPNGKLQECYIRESWAMK